MVRKLETFATQGVVSGIEVAVADAFCDTQQLRDLQEGKIEGRLYRRRGYPTQRPAETRIAEMEHAESALLFCSGMAAVSTTLSALVKDGQRVLITDEGNVTIQSYFTKVLPGFGIEVATVPIDELANLKDYINRNTVLFFSELPINPFLRVIDLNNLVSVAKERDIITIIDSTFASPLNIQPLDYGVDLVLHSATKYLGGHHDLSAGIIAGKEEIISKIREYRNLFGTNIAPLDYFLLTRSLHTFNLTMNLRNKNALEIAHYLESHPKVKKVWYSGCESHPDYAIAKKQMYGFGGVITFELKANEEETSKFIDALTIPYLAHNFGGCTSTIEQHVLFTHYDQRAEAQRRGLSGNLLRYSVGFEDVEEIKMDFEKAFQAF